MEVLELRMLFWCYVIVVVVVIDQMGVCVTGGSGYIASFLAEKLLKNGYKIHATLRNLEDKSKVGLLKSFPNAEKKFEVISS